MGIRFLSFLHDRTNLWDVINVDNRFLGLYTEISQGLSSQHGGIL